MYWLKKSTEWCRDDTFLLARSEGSSLLCASAKRLRDFECVFLLMVTISSVKHSFNSVWNIFYLVCLKQAGAHGCGNSFKRQPKMICHFCKTVSWTIPVTFYTVEKKCLPQIIFPHLCIKKNIQDSHRIWDKGSAKYLTSSCCFGFLVVIKHRADTTQMLSLSVKGSNTKESASATSRAELNPRHCKTFQHFSWEKEYHFIRFKITFHVIFQCVSIYKIKLDGDKQQKKRKQTQLTNESFIFFMTSNAFLSQWELLNNNK